MNSTRLDKILLAVILLAGIILRFYNYENCPLIHDEISTLLRSGYKNFGELIEKGVKTDVHPPGLIVLVHYWREIFGSSLQAIKFPFVIAGILSILVAYKIAAQWFNQTTALLTAVVISASQYTIFYSLIARPYSMGMLASLLLVYCQWNYFKAERRKNFWLIGFILSGIACIYLHYFSLLFTGIVCLTGFFIVEKQKRFAYLIACLVMAFSFLPMLPLFFSHLSRTTGEQSWIGKPNLGFIARYVFYLNHFSWWYFGTLVLIIALPFFISKREKAIRKINCRVLCAIFFLVPLVIGYLFSALIYPVLEFSGLIFSFAFLPMFLFSFSCELKPSLKIISVSALLLISIVTLIFERKHFELFYNQGINKIIAEIKSSGQITGTDSCGYYVNVEKYFLDYYGEKTKGLPIKLISVTNNHDVSNLKKQIERGNKKYIAFGTVTTYPTEMLAVIQQEYPFLLKQYKGFLTEFYLFSKEKSNTDSIIEETIFKSAEDFRVKKEGWKFDEREILVDTQNRAYYQTLDVSDSVPVFSMPLKSIMNNYSDIVTVSMQVFASDTFSLPSFLMQTVHNGKVLDEKKVKLSDYVNPGQLSEVFLSSRFTDISINFKHADLRIIINPANTSLKIFKIGVEVKKGNPYLYGLSFH